MKPFDNETNDGNEKAIRRGRIVPDGAVNLAWTKSPQLSPEKNIVVVDTSRVVEENTINASGNRKVMYANSLGILEDKYGNQLVEDEFPVVSDTFIVDEDWSTVPGDEYTDQDVLPFVHRSRHFHVDWAGLVLNNDLIEYKTDAIKVVDSKGREYVDDKAKPRYKIKITTAYARPIDADGQVADQGAYRVYAYVDTDVNEELYLVYNKVEVDHVTEDYKNHEPNFKEILNPVPYYDYTPEESEVVDPYHRDKQIYCTKPVSLKQQILDEPIQGKDGYRVFVPKKAIGDPRIFQLFRWRVSTTYTKSYKIDPNSGIGVRAGVIVTNAQPQSRSSYAFLNLSRSAYNVTEMNFYNPLSVVGDGANTEEAKETAAYWHVNLDTVSQEDLAKFDILIWSPQSFTLPVKKYTSKLDYFTHTKGGTLFIDTNSYSQTDFLTLLTTVPVMNNGAARFTGTPTGYANLAQFFPVTNDILFDGGKQLGGWNFNDGTADEYATMSSIRSVYGGAKVHYIRAHPLDWKVVARARATTGPNIGTNVPVILRKPHGKGNYIYSSMGITMSCSWLFNHVTGAQVSTNLGPELARYDDYRLYINASVVEGAMKFLFNASLLAVKGRVLDDTDEETFSTSWTFSTDWKSSWVIAAGNDVLSEHEKQENDFVFLPKDINDPVPVWQRKLLYGDKSKTMKDLMDSVLTPDMKERVKGSEAEYVIEVTNSNVEVPTTLGDNSFPYAWTEAFTPKFTVPVELGPHVIRAEDVKGRFDAGQYMHRTYPSKPYSGQVRMVHFDSEEFNTVQPVNWSASGTATETITTGQYTPPKTTTSERTLSWQNDGGRQIAPSPWIQEFRAPQPIGVSTWQNWNYKNSAWGPGILNWPHFGLYGRWASGSRGEVVSFIQDALNVFAFFGFYGGPGLTVDGNYGSKTAQAVLNFQTTFQARYIDGVVDAETMSIIGNQILRAEHAIRSSRANSGYYRFYYWAFARLKRQAISNNSKADVYGKRSWFSGGPSIIWEMYMIEFAGKYNIHGVSFTPHVEGSTSTSWFRSIDIRTRPFNLINYDSRKGSPIYMHHRPRDGQTIYVPITPRNGDTLIIGHGQDGGTGFGSSRMLGVRDITAHARVTTTTPGVNTIKKYLTTIPVSCSGTAFVTSRTDVAIVLQPKGYTGKGELSNFKWNNITIDNPDVEYEVVKYGSATVLILRSQLTSTQSTTSITTGPKLPEGGTYYWMNDQKIRSGLKESGYVSKTDGLKLLCTADKKPFGFPTVLPTNVGPNEAQRHYAKLSLVSYANDATVMMGFYDVVHKEFIVNNVGEPEMSYLEYLQRGPQNIYIGVLSTYEMDSQQDLPSGDDAPPIPFKWAMPVYGLYKRNGSKIALEPLPANLGSDEIWPIGIRVGKFTRSVGIRSAAQGPLTSYLNKYQGTTVQAFYGIPEADLAGWSALYGPPNSDIRDEQPMIVDDNVIQVRQAPIYALEVPTGLPSMADPVRPVFQVYHRTTRNSPWVEIPLHKIRDYNLSTGEIVLSEAMEETDPSLWKVSYTSAKRLYKFKEYEGTILNLNPYLDYADQFVGKGIYVYIVPEFVKDKNGATIPESVVDRSLRFTLEPTVFDPLSPDYDPLAIQLGVIYLSTALDIKDLTILDTRRRGGGAKENANVDEIVRLVSEASNYWDISYGSGLSYQKGGFVIIRLPKELQSMFSESEIIEVIERNITAGVRYKIEDLEGREWAKV